METDPCFHTRNKAQFIQQGMSSPCSVNSHTPSCARTALPSGRKNQYCPFFLNGPCTNGSYVELCRPRSYLPPALASEEAAASCDIDSKPPPAHPSSLRHVDAALIILPRMVCAYGCFALAAGASAFLLTEAAP